MNGSKITKIWSIKIRGKLEMLTWYKGRSSIPHNITVISGAENVHAHIIVFISAAFSFSRVKSSSWSTRVLFSWKRRLNRGSSLEINRLHWVPPSSILTLALIGWTGWKEKVAIKIVCNNINLHGFKSLQLKLIHAIFYLTKRLFYRNLYDTRIRCPFFT